MAGTETSRLGGLALAWLLTRAEGKGSRGDLSRALRPLVEHRWTGGEWSTQLDEELAALTSGGLMRQTERKVLTLTSEGRARALAVLGVKSLKGVTWKQLKRTHLVVLALGLPPSPGTLGRIGSADGLRAVLVQRQLGTGTPGTRSLTQVRDALCWKQLGVETDKPFTLAAVQSLLLSRVLPSSRELAPGQALRQLAARGVEARRPDADSLRLAALRSWLAASEAPAAAPAPGTPSDEAEGVDTLKRFAERVLQAARSSTTGRFGTHKVFISHVWHALQEPSLDVHTFKNRLLEAKRHSLLTLSRADLVEAMDPKDVSASEINEFGSTFHFITL
jgi:hypothetical protein